MYPWATCSLFFLILKMEFKVFKKNLKLDLHVDNVMFYRRANSQLEIPYIRSCAIRQILNNVQFQNLKIR
jgi:hypothetical protein